MSKIQVPTNEQVDTKAEAIFAKLKQALGMTPNLYATIGYSSNTLEAYLQYDQTVSTNSFTKKENEAIKLIVSEVNGCVYCLAAHTVIGKMNGLTEAETIAIRTATIEDNKLQAITKTAQAVAINKGKISDEVKDHFFSFGYGPKELVELIAVVNAISFTNFIHNATEVPVDFPTAPALTATTV